jgi:hypothetical protein
MTSHDSSACTWRSRIGCAVLVCGSVAAGCNGNSMMGPSDGDGQPQASLSMRVAGNPLVGVQAMLVTFAQLRARRDNGLWVGLTFANGATRTCDLKRLSGPSDALAVGSFAAGHFNAVRVELSSATLYFDKAATGPACAPAIDPPAGQNASVQLTSRAVVVDHHFSVGPSATTLTVIFDGDQSITTTDSRFDNGVGDALIRWPVVPTGVFSMTPVIRIVG